MNYTPLYIKSDNSLLESMIKIPDLIEYAKAKNLKTLALSDNTMFGVKEFYDLCIKNDIKPVIGLEVKYETLPFILYAINNEGYRNLIKISTIISTDTLTIDLIDKYSSNLICILPYNSKKLCEELKKIYNNFYLGYENKEELKNLSGDNLVYIKEIKVLSKNDIPYLKYLEAMKDGKIVSQIDTPPDSFLDEEIPIIYPETLKNNQEIINMCNVKIEYQKDLIPVFECPNNMDSFTYLKKLSIKGLKEKFGEKTYQVYVDRLKYELEVINEMGFCNYFLIVNDYVNYARENDIFCHARGSAAGSLVAYLLNITGVDPIKYNLVFERFLNKMRISMPDIDMDFEDVKREQVINYCVNKYGTKKVAQIVSFITLKPKLAIRDVGRTMDFKQEEIDKICKLLKDTDKKNKPMSLIDNYKTNRELMNYLKASKDRLNLYYIAMKFENMKKTTSIHPAGVVLCQRELDEVIPLIKNGNMYLTAYSMDYLESLGLLKMDFLGLRNLTIISNILKDLKQSNINIDFDKIPLDDEKTINIFKNANTIGIFQFEKDGMRKFLEQLKPNCFEDIFAALALYRPGPANNIDLYVKRKHNKEKINYYHKDLEHILKPTYGVIIYQEQIMQIANVMADYTLGEADLLRKAISKKKDSIMLKNIEEFKSRAIKKGYDSRLVDEVSNFIVKFASFGFNRSHSVAYAIISYKLAYLKAHYPTYFMRYIMTNAIGRSLTTKDYIYECKLNDISVLKPDINYSFKEYTVYNNKIRYPLSNIKNVGSMVVDEILKEREKGKFLNIYDFVKRCYSKTVNRKVIISLIQAGCFDDFSYNHKTLIENIDEIINYGELIRYADENSTLKPDIQIVNEYSTNELMSQEIEIFGFYLSNHPVTDIKLKYKNDIAIKDISKYLGKNIDIIVSIRYIKVITTKKNEDMGFITGEDETGNIEIVIFPKLFKTLIDLKPGLIIKCYGQVERRYSDYQISARDVLVIEE